MKKFRNDILKKLKQNGYSQSRLKKDGIFGGKTLDSLRIGNPNISVKTLIQIQDILKCDFNDFFE